MKQKKKRIKVTIEDHEVESYLERWRDNDSFRDFNLAMDKGLIIYALDLIMGAGAIEEGIDEESDQVCAWYDKYATKKAIKKEWKLLLRHVEVWINPETNEHAFIPVGDGVDYFMRKQDLQRMGLVFDHRYGPRGGNHKTSVLES